MNTHQLAILSVVVAISAADKIWTGSQANHVLGELVQDTPEVAEVKRNHAQVFALVRSILPELPPEDDDSVVTQVPDSPQYQFVHPVVTTYRPAVSFSLPSVTPPALVPLDPVTSTSAPWTGPFADHKLGQLVKETPEVAQARKYHEEVFARVRATLPELYLDEEEHRPVLQINQRTQSVHVPQDSDYDVAATHLKDLDITICHYPLLCH